MSSPEPSISPLRRPDYGRRILLLCLPSWGAAFWSVILLIVSALHITPAKLLLLSKPIITLVTMTALLAPVCWIAAIVSAFRVHGISGLHKIALAASAVAIVCTWIAILYYMRQH
jgi:hypothetical protein